MSPLSAAEMDRLFDRVVDTVYATLYGTVAVAAVQGTLGGVMFWWLGLSAPLPSCGARTPTIPFSQPPNASTPGALASGPVLVRPTTHTDSGRRTRLGFLCGREAG